MGLALTGCDHTAAEGAEPPTSDPATPTAADTEAEANTDHAPSEPEVAAEPEAPSDVADVDRECPEGSELPDPPCFYIL